MLWDAEGFLKPDVDINSCIDCGICVKRCPALDEVKSSEFDNNSLDHVVSYGAWNTDMAIQKSSSSGGIFTALSNFVFQHGGCVFGVVWKNSTTAIFKKAENLSDLEPMRGSKYTQAIPGYVYREVKNELLKDRYVLFSGTACQVHALRCFLRKDYERLFTFDIVCHGVPSKKILESYVSNDEKATGKVLDNIYFRYKDNDWLNYKVQKRYTDGSVVNIPASADLFMNLFLCNQMLNRACYNCPHAHLPRPGDLTLGDFWGIQKIHPEWPVSHGISSLIANTDKGNDLLHKLAQEGTIILNEEPFQHLLQGQPHSYIRPKKTIPQKHRKLLSDLNNKNIVEIHNSCCKCINFLFFRINRKSPIVNFFRKLIK